MRTLPLAGLIVTLATAACAGSAAGPGSTDPTSLVVNINHAVFASDAVLTVELWNAAQLAALDANARCAVVQGPGGTQTACPPGVTYQDVSPQRLQVPVATLGATLEVTPQQISPGEMFRIHLSGLSPDRCNVSAADLTRTAAPGRMMLGDPPWQTTLRACATP